MDYLLDQTGGVTAVGIETEQELGVHIPELEDPEEMEVIGQLQEHAEDTSKEEDTLPAVSGDASTSPLFDCYAMCERWIFE